MTRFAPRLFLIATALLLAACKADRFDVAFATGDLAAARDGTVREAPFEMVFEGIGELDADKRADMAAFERIMRSYMTIDSFVVEPGDESADLMIEGRLPISSDPNTRAPYFLQVSPSVDFAGYTEIEMANGGDYGRMREEMRDVDFMLTPDRYQPTRIKLAGNGETIVAPGAYVDGEPEALFVGPVESALWLSFKGGVYDDTGALLLVKLD